MSQPDSKTISDVMRELGKRTSKRKADSSRANGKLGGRPKSKPDSSLPTDKK